MAIPELILGNIGPHLVLFEIIHKLKLLSYCGQLGILKRSEFKGVGGKLVVSYFTSTIVALI